MTDPYETHHNLANFCFELLVQVDINSSYKKTRFIFVQRVLEGELGIADDYSKYSLSDYRKYLNKADIDKEFKDCFGLWS